MKKIKIKFVNWWKGFDENDNFIINSLKKYYQVEISNDPQYLFYSCVGMKRDFLNYDCIRIFFTGENIRPDFNICDYGIGFDYMEFEDRYLRYPLFMVNQYLNDTNLAISRTKIDNVVNRNFCAYLAAHCPKGCPREDFVKKLSQYKKVDCGGKSLKNVDYNVEDKLEWQKNYKFSICFENTSTSGYTTEKLVQGFASRTIPIYWGNPRVAEEFNPKAFINCNDYSSFDEVIDMIKYLDTHDDEYQEMLNQPVFLESAFNTYLKDDYLDRFLRNIIDQPYSEARRVNRGYWWGQQKEADLHRLDAYDKIYWNPILRRVIRYLFRIDMIDPW